MNDSKSGTLNFKFECNTNKKVIASLELKFSYVEFSLDNYR